MLGKRLFGGSGAWLALALAWPSPQAVASDMSGVVPLNLASMCMIQDPAFRSSLWARELAARPNFVGWAALDEMPKSRCLRERRWIPVPLCQSLQDLDLADRVATKAWNAQHHAEVMPLVAALEFMMSGTGEAEHCPSLNLAP